eukprot:54493-Eustigmatos_ZCMA.PRE.1
MMRSHAAVNVDCIVTPIQHIQPWPSFGFPPPTRPCRKMSVPPLDQHVERRDDGPQIEEIRTHFDAYTPSRFWAR